MEEAEPSRICALALNDTTAIDGSRKGNEARFFNHSCDPNGARYVFDGTRTSTRCGTSAGAQS